MSKFEIITIYVAVLIFMAALILMTPLCVIAGDVGAIPPPPWLGREPTDFEQEFLNRNEIPPWWGTQNPPMSKETYLKGFTLDNGYHWTEKSRASFHEWYFAEMPWHQAMRELKTALARDYHQPDYWKQVEDAQKKLRATYSAN